MAKVDENLYQQFLDATGENLSPEDKRQRMEELRRAVMQRVLRFQSGKDDRGHSGNDIHQNNEYFNETRPSTSGSFLSLKGNDWGDWTIPDAETKARNDFLVYLNAQLAGQSQVSVQSILNDLETWKIPKESIPITPAFLEPPGQDERAEINDGSSNQIDLEKHENSQEIKNRDLNKPVSRDGVLSRTASNLDMFYGQNETPMLENFPFAANQNFQKPQPLRECWSPEDRSKSQQQKRPQSNNIISVAAMKHFFTPPATTSTKIARNLVQAAPNFLSFPQSNDGKQERHRGEWWRPPSVASSQADAVSMLSSSTAESERSRRFWKRYCYFPKFSPCSMFILGIVVGMLLVGVALVAMVSADKNDMDETKCSCPVASGYTGSRFHGMHGGNRHKPNNHDDLGDNTKSEGPKHWKYPDDKYKGKHDSKEAVNPNGSENKKDITGNDAVANSATMRPSKDNSRNSNNITSQEKFHENMNRANTSVDQQNHQSNADNLGKQDENQDDHNNDMNSSNTHKKGVVNESFISTNTPNSLTSVINTDLPSENDPFSTSPPVTDQNKGHESSKRFTDDFMLTTNSNVPNSDKQGTTNNILNYSEMATDKYNPIFSTEQTSGPDFGTVSSETTKVTKISSEANSYDYTTHVSNDQTSISGVIIKEPTATDAPSSLLSKQEGRKNNETPGFGTPKDVFTNSPNDEVSKVPVIVSPTYVPIPSETHDPSEERDVTHQTNVDNEDNHKEKNEESFRYSTYPNGEEIQPVKESNRTGRNLNEIHSGKENDRQGSKKKYNYKDVLQKWPTMPDFSKKSERNKKLEAQQTTPETEAIFEGGDKSFNANSNPEGIKAVDDQSTENQRNRSGKKRRLSWWERLIKKVKEIVKKVNPFSSSNGVLLISVEG